MWGGGDDRKMVQRFLGGEDNVLKLSVGIVAPNCEYTEHQCHALEMGELYDMLYFKALKSPKQTCDGFRSSLGRSAATALLLLCDSI